MRRIIPSAAALAVCAGLAHAGPFTDGIVSNLTDLGYEFIEIKEGPGQVKVEAIRGTEKLEVVYDRATGRILKQERERADADDFGRRGVQFDIRNRDFIGDDRDDRDDEDDNRDDRRSGRDDDDHDDDDYDDDDDDNSGSGSGSGDRSGSNSGKG